MPLLAVLAALALPGLAADAAAGTLPAFSGEDEARMVGELCGPVKPGSALRNEYGSDRLETVSGYLSQEGSFLRAGGRSGLDSGPLEGPDQQPVVSHQEPFRNAAEGAS